MMWELESYVIIRVVGTGEEGNYLGVCGGLLFPSPNYLLFLFFSLDFTLISDSSIHFSYYF
jgi:hypothetical protein